MLNVSMQSPIVFFLRLGYVFRSVTDSVNFGVRTSLVGIGLNPSPGVCLLTRGSEGSTDSGIDNGAPLAMEGEKKMGMDQGGC